MYVILFCAKVNIEVCLKIGLRKKWKDMVSSMTTLVEHNGAQCTAVEQSRAQANPRPKQNFCVNTILTFQRLADLRFRIRYPDTGQDE